MWKGDRERDDIVDPRELASHPARKAFAHTVGDTGATAVFRRGLGDLIGHFHDTEQDIGETAAKFAESILATGDVFGIGHGTEGENEGQDQEQSEEFAFHVPTVAGLRPLFNFFPLPASVRLR